MSAPINESKDLKTPLFLDISPRGSYNGRKIKPIQNLDKNCDCSESNRCILVSTSISALVAIIFFGMTIWSVVENERNPAIVFGALTGFFLLTGGFGALRVACAPKHPLDQNRISTDPISYDSI